MSGNNKLKQEETGGAAPVNPPTMNDSVVDTRGDRGGAGNEGDASAQPGRGDAGDGGGPLISLQTPPSPIISPAGPASVRPVDQDENNDNGDDLGAVRRYPAGDPRNNRPGPRSDNGWEWAPGTILDPARVNVPEPHKFFRVRRNVNDYQDVDMRIYPSANQMDWSDADHVAALNKYWSQVEGRTKGVGKQSENWTQAEKDVVIAQIKDALKAGANSSTLDWKAVAKGLSDAFQDKTQAKGTPLAQRTRVVDGQIKGHYLNPKKLAADRTGPVDRKWAEVKNMAEDWAEVLQLLRENQPAGIKEKRNDKLFERLHDKVKEKKEKAAAKKKRGAEEGGEASKEGEGGASTSAKKRKLKAPLPFKVAEDLPSKDHEKKGPPPPPTGGADFAGALPAPIAGH